MKQQTLAIDFDGTLCKKQSFKDGFITEIPNEGARDALWAMQKEGYKIVIFSTRLNPKMRREGDISQHNEITNWLIKHDIPYDELSEFKPSAVAYIDDRAVRFTDWNDMKNLFVQ